MTRSKLIYLKNAMLIANMWANISGVFFANILLRITKGVLHKQELQHPFLYWTDKLLTLAALFFLVVMTVLYEKPIRRYLNLSFKRTSIRQHLEIKARQRLLNEPFVLMGFDLGMWLLASTIYPIIHWAYGSQSEMLQSALHFGLSNGLITVTVAFFLLEHILNKRLARHFFPKGGLTAVPRTLRITYRTRLVALLVACNLIPLISIMQILQQITTNEQNLSAVLPRLRLAIFTASFLFLGVGIFLTLIIGKGLSILFKEIVQTLKRVRNGQFDKKLQVFTNDEMGYTGDVINEMIEGLQKRERMQQSLDLAKEVQQNLLPDRDPEIRGLDIAGASIYCEETGGDYYDYLVTGEIGRQKICVVVGDVADHGIQSALLMATARAFLRQSILRSRELNRVVADVNLQLTRDVKDSGRFMTLFLSVIDRGNQIMHWVNAGHDPALIYDRDKGTFEELTGKALPLGVSETSVYQEFNRTLASGQMIIMGTDGIWEARNSTEEMFGKERFKAIVRENAHRPAKDIVQAVIKQVDNFCHPLRKADDITLVITRII